MKLPLYLAEKTKQKTTTILNNFFIFHYQGLEKKYQFKNASLYGVMQKNTIQSF